MEIGNWGVSAGNNGFASPDGAQDGWLGAQVNNVVREIMAVLRRWYSDPEYLNLCWTATNVEATFTRNSATQITINGMNATSVMTANRRVRITGTTPSSDEGTILGSVFSSPNTIVDVEMAAGSVPTSPTHVYVHAIKSLPSSAFVGSPPAGTIIDYAGTVIPLGYLECNGAAVSKATYAALWACFGSAHVWGADPGSGNFLLPDLRGKVALGWKSGGDSDGDYGTVGGAYGEKKHILTVAELATHDHAITDPGHYHSQYQLGATNPSVSTSSANYGNTAAITDTKTTGITINTNGSSAAHETRQPSVVVHKLIKT